MRYPDVARPAGGPVAVQDGVSFRGIRWLRSPVPPVALLLVAVLAGCGRSGLESKVVHGTVTVGGQQPDAGEVRFVPIDGTPGATCVGTILDGHYEIKARGGVPLGKHRVEVDARRKTGKQIEQDNGFETALVDETVPMGPPEYAGDRSPLVRETTSSSDGRFDIEIPAR